MKRYWKRRERGFGLLETAITLVVIGGLAASILLMASNHHVTQARDQVVEEVQLLNRTIQRAYSGVAQYPVFDPTVEAQLFDLLPPRIVDRDNSTLRSAFGGVYRLGTEGASGCGTCRNVLRVRVAGLDRDDCKALMPMDFGKHSFRVGVGQGYGPATTYATPVPPAQADTICSPLGGSNVSFYVYFNK